ncbi:MAG: GTPase, partial [Chloroflexota bacterium]
EDEIRSRWRAGWPVTFASALHGRGVHETFRLLLERAYDVLDEPFGLASGHRLSRDSFVAGLCGGAARVG